MHQVRRNGRSGQGQPRERALPDFVTSRPLPGDADAQPELDQFLDRFDRAQLDPVAQLGAGADEVLLDEPEGRALAAVEDHPLLRELAAVDFAGWPRGAAG